MRCGFIGKSPVSDSAEAPPSLISSVRCARARAWPSMSGKWWSSVRPSLIAQSAAAMSPTISTLGR